MRRRSLSKNLVFPVTSVVVLVILAAACGANAAGKNLGGQVTPPGYKAATRSVSECAPVRAKALTSTDTTGMQMPTPSMMSLASEPLPKDLAGKSVDIFVHVNEKGRVINDAAAVRVEGIGEHRYVPFLRDNAYSYRFWPGVLEGCAVPAWTRVHLDFPALPAKDL